MTALARDLRTDTPQLTHYLAAAVRFVDPFTGLPIREQFSLSIPTLKWLAVWSPSDWTYRFLKTNIEAPGGVPKLPTGTFDLTMELREQQNSSLPLPAAMLRAPYEAFEPLKITLPPTAPHASPILVSDYLVDLTLWPTSAFALPAGETAVVGQIISASAAPVSGLKVIVFPGTVPPVGTPYTYSDRAGQFLFRLPRLKRKVGVLVANLGIRVLDASGTALIVTPSLFPSPAPLGLVTRNLTFNVP